MKKHVYSILIALWCLASARANEQAPVYEKLRGADRQPVLMLGDSMMRLLSRAMERALQGEKIEASSFTSLGSGLARLDALDWYAKIEEVMQARKPSTVVITLGANDRQAMRNDEGEVLQFGSQAWREEYASRVGRAMDTLIENGAKRVIWLDLPDMREPTQQAFSELANAIYREQVAINNRGERIVLYDVRSIVSRTPGRFTMFIMSPRGEALTVRDPDGIHLTTVGARLVAEKLVETFWKP